MSVTFWSIVNVFLPSWLPQALYRPFSYYRHSRWVRDLRTEFSVSYQHNLDVDKAAGKTFNSMGENFNAGLIRIDNEGKVLWANEYGGLGQEEIIGLDMDAEGNIYAAGVFSAKATFGGDELVGMDKHEVMLAGYSGAGVHLWSHAYNGLGFDQALDLEVRNNGVYLTGRYKHDLKFGNIVLNSKPNNYDIFVGRFSTSNGLPTWAVSVGSDENDQGNGIGLGGDGGIYVGGYVMGAVTFGGAETPAPGKVTDSAVFRFTEK